MNKVLCETQTGETVWANRSNLKLRVSAYGILKRKDKVLVVQQHLPLWEFPGGGVEKGENLSNTLIREFKEETGLSVSIDRLILVRESFYLAPSKKLYHSFQNFFLVKKLSGKLSKKSNSKMIDWVNLNSLTSEKMNKAAYDALSALSKKNGISQFVSSIISRGKEDE